MASIQIHLITLSLIPQWETLKMLKKILISVFVTQKWVIPGATLLKVDTVFLKVI